MDARGLACRMLVTLCVVAATFAGLAASALAAAAPTVEFEWLEAVGATSATFRALINPGESDTTYRFEYGTDTSYGSNLPVPDGDVGSGSEAVAVSALAASLTPGVAYHYRVVATNAEGTTFGPDRHMSTFSSAASADTCPNAQLRGAQSAQFLPECRAYEMVSPVDKRGGNISAAPWKTRISADGNAVQYTSLTGFGDAFGSTTVGTEYMAERDVEGWVTHAITPEQKPPSYPALRGHYEGDFSSDLSKGVFYAVAPVTSGEVSLADSNVEKISNLYLRNDLRTAGGGSYELLTGCTSCTEPLSAESFSAFPSNPPALAGASADFSHVIFESFQNLTAQAKGTGAKLYESVNGKVRLAGILPDSACEAPPCVAEESIAGRGAIYQNEHYIRRRVYTTNTISADGSRIIFTAGQLVQAENEISNFSGEEGSAGDLYMRESGTKTVQLNISERLSPNPNGSQPAIFEGATSDDSKIFFETSQALTEDDTDTSPVMDLYMYDVNAPNGHHLTLITKDSQASEYESRPRSTHVAGISADGSYVYFVGANSLLKGEPDYEAGTGFNEAPDGGKSDCLCGTKALFVISPTTAPTPVVTRSTGVKWKSTLLRRLTNFA